MTWTEVATIIAGLVLGYCTLSWVIRATRRGLVREGEQHSDLARRQADADTCRDTAWIQAHWHEVLGVPAIATPEEINSAYRRKIRLYHPDRTEGRGPELQAIALQKTQELNIAYAWAMKLMGVELQR